MNRRTTIAWIPALLMVALNHAPGQTAATAPPAFEVASVKLNETPSRTPVRFGADSVTLTSVDLRIALILAYNVRDFQIVGPDWLRDNDGAKRFNVTAKASHAVPEEQLRLMLRTLVAERFHLTLHWDKKVLPVIAMLPAKGGPKFHKSDAGTTIDSQWLGFPNVIHSPTHDPDGRTRQELTNAPMAALASLLSAGIGGGVDPVLDLTGLPGRYDFVFVGPPPPSVGDPPPTPDDKLAVFKAIAQDQLGLTLERRKAPLDILVIDHADKVPTEN